MFFEEPGSKRKKILIFGSIFLTLVLILAFLGEIFDLFKIAEAILLIPIRLQFVFPTDLQPLTVPITLYNIIVGVAFPFLVWVILISQQALLPVRNLTEVIRTAWHFVLFIIRRHGQAILVRDGKVMLSSEDLAKREGQGVIVVHFNSAIVLEERNPAIGLMRPINKLWLGFLTLIGLMDEYQSPRACGPGIVFTRPLEKIRGVVDLRRQFRIEPKIACYTRDGIELVANVLTGFTIGESPDVLTVAYAGELKAENLRVITLEKISAGNVNRVKDITDELDSDDKEEIHRCACQVEEDPGFWSPLYKKSIPQKSRRSRKPNQPANKPVFDEERVFAAVFGQALNKNQEVLPWTELPTRVAADFYREILSQTNYDELYELKKLDNWFPLPAIKRKLMLRMRNNGILSFRLIRLHSRHEFIKDQTYHERDIEATEARPLTASKMLRDRGIKVKFSSFGDPSPVSPAIYMQRVNNWEARWERDTSLIHARRDLEALRTRSRAHALAQRELADSLSKIFQTDAVSEEAIALRIMQALEKAGTDPKTRELLPGNTIELMRMAQNLLMPKETIQKIH